MSATDGTDQHIGEWLAAADAARRGDAVELADAMSGQELPDREYFGTRVTFLITGAIVVAGEVANALGEKLPLPASRKVVFGTPPGVEAPADVRVAHRITRLALHGHNDAVADVVLAYVAPDEAGLGRLTDLAMALLRLLVTVQTQPAAP